MHEELAKNEVLVCMDDGAWYLDECQRFAFGLNAEEYTFMSHCLDSHVLCCQKRVKNHDVVKSPFSHAFCATKSREKSRSFM